MKLFCVAASFVVDDDDGGWLKSSDGKSILFILSIFCLNLWLDNLVSLRFLVIVCSLPFTPLPRLIASTCEHLSTRSWLNDEYLFRVTLLILHGMRWLDDDFNNVEYDDDEREDEDDGDDDDDGDELLVNCLANDSNCVSK